VLNLLIHCLSVLLQQLLGKWQSACTEYTQQHPYHKLPETDALTDPDQRHSEVLPRAYATELMHQVLIPWAVHDLEASTAAATAKADTNTVKSELALSFGVSQTDEPHVLVEAEAFDTDTASSSRSSTDTSLGDCLNSVAHEQQFTDSVET
jgi:hypothetical protein